MQLAPLALAASHIARRRRRTVSFAGVFWLGYLLGVLPVLALIF